MKYVEEIFSGPKTTIFSDYITIVGFNYLYWRRKLTLDTIEKFSDREYIKTLQMYKSFIDCSPVLK